MIYCRKIQILINLFHQDQLKNTKQNHFNKLLNKKIIFKVVTLVK